MSNLAVMIGNRLRELRRQNGLRQEDMERFGVSYKYYQRIEQGKANITLSTIEKLATAFGMKAKDLLFFPAHESDDVNELMALLTKIINANEMDKVKKINVFLKEILG